MAQTLYVLVIHLHGDTDPVTFVHCDPGTWHAEAERRAVEFNKGATLGGVPMTAELLSDEQADRWYGIRAARPVTI